MADYILTVLIFICVILAVVDLVLFIRKDKYTNKYNYMYTGVDKDVTRCNCMGQQTVPTYGGDVQTMSKSPLSIGVGN